MVSLTTSFGLSTVRSHGFTSWKFLELKNVKSLSIGAITLKTCPVILWTSIRTKAEVFKIPHFQLRLATVDRR